KPAHRHQRQRWRRGVERFSLCAAHQRSGRLSEVGSTSPLSAAWRFGSRSATPAALPVAVHAHATVTADRGRAPVGCTPGAVSFTSRLRVNNLGFGCSTTTNRRLIADHCCDMLIYQRLMVNADLSANQISGFSPIVRISATQPLVYAPSSGSAHP